MISPFFQFVLASVLSSLFLAAILPYLRQKLIDNPNERSSHVKPTPRGGGIVFVIVGTALHLLFTSGVSAWIPIICLPLAIVGLLDDYYDLPAKYRYAFQILTALAILVLDNITLPLWLFPVAIIAVTALINFMNFMDGMDGLLAGCAVLLMVATSQWALAGAIFGFLLWNWSPAKVFMGDVGSTFIGSIFVGFALQSGSLGSSTTIFLMAFPLYADAFFCVIRRFIAGQNIFTAHKYHLYQRLNQAGWKHNQVAGLYIASVLLLMTSNHLGGWHLLVLAIIAEFLLAIYIDSKIAIRFQNR
jgi:UDP-N-acetylmuramyl pentapeptide phosphotransferase/UDP-N-acetylglucosamine-1-phosphate transferase